VPRRSGCLNGLRAGADSPSGFQIPALANRAAEIRAAPDAILAPGIPFPQSAP
jgi:hypothetical protein